jgi:hypothetical protein
VIFLSHKSSAEHGARSSQLEVAGLLDESRGGKRTTNCCESGSSSQSICQQRIVGSKFNARAHERGTLSATIYRYQAVQALGAPRWHQCSRARDRTPTLHARVQNTLTIGVAIFQQHIRR